MILGLALANILSNTFFKFDRRRKEKERKMAWCDAPTDFVKCFPIERVIDNCKVSVVLLRPAAEIIHISSQDRENPKSVAPFSRN